MSILSKSCKNICTYLGKNNNALYGALTIAVSKGILRPTFTMMDDKQDKKSRVYTAFREGTTGAVAFGAYILTNHFVEKMAKPICEKAKIPGKINQVKSTLSLISVSLTALFIIPAVCNAITKPLLDFFTGKQQSRNTNTDITPSIIQKHTIPPVQYNNYHQTFTHSLSPFNYRMKVGL